jgi:hypothetical protein
MSSKKDFELELRYLENLEEALEDAELKGFKEDCKYLNSNGEEYIAEYDPRPYEKHRKNDPTEDVFLICGENQGCILNKKTWGEVIKTNK